MKNLSQRPITPSENMVVRKIAEETLLVPIKNNAALVDNLYTLNSVGAFLWDRIDGTRSFDQLEEALLSQYEVSREKAHEDLKEFIEELRALGALLEEEG